MKKIITVICCLMLVSCSSISKEEALNNQQLTELDDKGDQVILIDENQKDELNLLHEEMEVLVEERDELKLKEAELLKLYNDQNEAYKYFDHVYETAHQVISNLLYEDNANYPEYKYSEYRLDELEYVYTEDELKVTIYRMNYTYKSLAPDNIVYAGAMQMTEDGWIVPTYIDSHYLIFRENSYLGHFFINDASPGSPVFIKDLEYFLKSDSIKSVRMDFIDGAQLHSFDMNANIAFELNSKGKDFYSISGESEGFITGVFEYDFDFHTQLPNDARILFEESFQTDLGQVKLVTLGVDLGSESKVTYNAYYAFIQVNMNEGYLFNYTKHDDLLSTKLEFMQMLTSIKKRDLDVYEKVVLKNFTISSNDGVDIVLKDGYFTNDEEPWNAMGSKWIGDFEIQVKKGDNIIITPIKPLWFNGILFFYAPEFELSFKDYNHDGLIDFALSQYVATNINSYVLLTILEDGSVVRTPFDVDYITGRTTRDNSPYLKVENNKIVSTFYNNTVGSYYKDYYEWDGEKYIHSKREEIDE